MQIQVNKMVPHEALYKIDKEYFHDANSNYVEYLITWFLNPHSHIPSRHLTYMEETFRLACLTKPCDAKDLVL